jgi:hypothetical protein
MLQWPSSNASVKRSPSFRHASTRPPLLCRRHHRAVHEEGYRVERMADGELRFRGPDGRVVPDVPCPPPAPSDPVSAVKIHNEAAGVAVDPRTATPTWQGERLDVRYAMDVLHPLANEKRTAA